MRGVADPAADVAVFYLGLIRSLKKSSVRGVADPAADVAVFYLGLITIMIVLVMIFGRV